MSHPPVLRTRFLSGTVTSAERTPVVTLWHQNLPAAPLHTRLCPRRAFRERQVSVCAGLGLRPGRLGRAERAATLLGAGVPVPGAWGGGVPCAPASSAHMPWRRLYLRGGTVGGCVPSRPHPMSRLLSVPPARRPGGCSLVAPMVEIRGRLSSFVLPQEPVDAPCTHE